MSRKLGTELEEVAWHAEVLGQGVKAVGGGAVTERGKLTGVCREDKSYAECSLF